MVSYIRLLMKNLSVHQSNIGLKGLLNMYSLKEVQWRWYLDVQCVNGISSEILFQWHLISYFPLKKLLKEYISNFTSNKRQFIYYAKCSSNLTTKFFIHFVGCFNRTIHYVFTLTRVEFSISQRRRENWTTKKKKN